ncbi:hypothetical protein HDV05_004245 [Chytridiales sp. JEL 0842]|nr:hypothetical protein HDV05_004245 [Chytridiales sp. JEL 0842]
MQPLETRETPAKSSTSGTSMPLLSMSPSNTGEEFSAAMEDIFDTDDVLFDQLVKSFNLPYLTNSITSLQPGQPSETALPLQISTPTTTTQTLPLPQQTARRPSAPSNVFEQSYTPSSASPSYQPPLSSVQQQSGQIHNSITPTTGQQQSYQSYSVPPSYSAQLSARQHQTRQGSILPPQPPSSRHQSRESQPVSSPPTHSTSYPASPETSVSSNIAQLVDIIQGPFDSTQTFHHDPTLEMLRRRQQQQHRQSSSRHVPERPNIDIGFQISTWFRDGEDNEPETWALADAFFKNQHDLAVPLLSPKYFFDDFYTHTPILMLAICAFGAKYVPALHKYKMWYYRKARSLVQDVVESPTLEGLQAVLILMMFSSTVGKTPTAWTLIGLGIRMALYMRYDVDPDHLPEGQSMTWAEKEARRRCWYFCYTVDSSFSALSSQPPMLRGIPSDVKGMCSEDQWAHFFDDAQAGGPANATIKSNLKNDMSKSGSSSSSRWSTDLSSFGGPFAMNLEADDDEEKKSDNPMNHFVKLADIFSDILVYNVMNQQAAAASAKQDSHSPIPMPSQSPTASASSSTPSFSAFGATASSSSSSVSPKTAPVSVPQPPSPAVLSQTFSKLETDLSKWVSSVPRYILEFPTAATLLSTSEDRWPWRHIQTFLTYHACLCMLNRDRLIQFIKMIAFRMPLDSTEGRKGKLAFDIARNSAMIVSDCTQLMWRVNPGMESVAGFLMFPIFHSTLILILLESDAGMPIVASSSSILSSMLVSASSTSATPPHLMGGGQGYGVMLNEEYTFSGQQQQEQQQQSRNSSNSPPANTTTSIPSSPQNPKPATPSSPPLAGIEAYLENLIYEYQSAISWNLKTMSLLALHWLPAKFMLMTLESLIGSVRKQQALASQLAAGGAGQVGFVRTRESSRASGDGAGSPAQPSATLSADETMMGGVLLGEEDMLLYGGNSSGSAGRPNWAAGGEGGGGAGGTVDDLNNLASEMGTLSISHSVKLLDAIHTSQTSVSEYLFKTDAEEDGV